MNANQERTSMQIAMSRGRKAQLKKLARDWEKPICDIVEEALTMFFYNHGIETKKEKP